MDGWMDSVSSWGAAPRDKGTKALMAYCLNQQALLNSWPMGFRLLRKKAHDPSAYDGQL